CSFEAGMTQMGGHAIFLDWRTTHLHSATLVDEVKCIERYADIIMARVFGHSDVEAIAAACSVPVINGLCNEWHPCQILGDLLTIKEKKGKLAGLKLAFVGDGCNTCNTLIVGGAMVGMQVSVATPAKYKPSAEAAAIGKKAGTYSWAESPQEAVKGADIVYTDTWVSMGFEGDASERERIFPPYQVNAALMKHAKPDAVFMHCMPVHRGVEVADEVLDGKQSVVFDQAENRLHIQKAIVLKLLNKG
ncbi:MAG: ornithine carbamoyltransferase, partial [Candidatus Diapherotrites archaeon]|nr:ornithine carbamoyltransferase [Candidatus Diapherotrites archaeon]